jgi:type III restriction enzyme
MGTAPSVVQPRNLLDLLRAQLEAQGVGVTTSAERPPPPMKIEAVQEKAAYDMAIPMTKPQLVHNIRKPSGLGSLALASIFDQKDLEKGFRDGVCDN